MAWAVREPGMLSMSQFRCTAPLLPVLLLAILLGASPAAAKEIQLKDGRTLRGKLGMVSSLAELAQAIQPDGSGALQLILLVDDDLRRTFISKRQVQGIAEEEGGAIVEKFLLQQRVMEGGLKVRSVGPTLAVKPFDEYGRRILKMFTARGPLDVIQGITVLTPTWTKVEGISHAWDMRIATSSIPREQLAQILGKLGDPADLEFRKRVARFYVQSERYEEASRELTGLLAQFPDDAKLKADLAPSIQRLRQLSARRVVGELRLRRDAGQHALVRRLLKQFSAEGIPGEELQAVREMLQEYDALETRRSDTLKRLESLVQQIDNPAIRRRLGPVLAEIGSELNFNTLDRMAAFRQMADDPTMAPAEKVSLAVTGWLLGAKEAAPGLTRALSLFDTRALIRQYLASPDKLTRAELLEKIQGYEGGTPSLVARILAQMKPPLELPEPSESLHCYALEVAGLPGAPPVSYLVALPPEYDPLRRYPAIVTLGGAGVRPEYQIDWWAGAWSDSQQMRQGQASRHGYIVIAPDWTAEHQKQYHYSAREHAAVLYCLRDACRRFAIDTDRVFLSGHSIGGDAAWDIGLAHPDLWAGVIPFAASSDKYCAIYWENAALVPYYFVCGELDGAKMTTNARDLDRYLKRGYNATVVEYLGRGHEDFPDEILRLFDWMGRFRRNFYPKKFTAVTMRPWDNFFWWVELAQLPTKVQVEPHTWPPPRGTQPVTTEATITATDSIFVKTGAGQVVLWLSPEMLDLQKRFSIVINGARLNLRPGALEPQVETILEDARTRGDRQHPFWIKLETPTGRLDGSR